MPKDSHCLINVLMAAASPVIEITGLGTKEWRRKVPADDARRGPWMELRYRLLDTSRWSRRAPCLYLVAAQDGGNRYVGTSKSGLRNRWRLAPAEGETKSYLFHSQCMRHVQKELTAHPATSLRVSVLFQDEIEHPNVSLGLALSLVPRRAQQGIAWDVERWLCSHRSEMVAYWNIAMTVGRARTRD
jgi:hypothetical protein